MYPLQCEQTTGAQKTVLYRREKRNYGCGRNLS